MAATQRAAIPAITGTGASISRELTTQASDSHLVIAIATSHGRTVSSPAFDGASMATGQITDANGNTVLTVCYLANPGAKTGNFTCTLSGTANYATAGHYVTGAGELLDSGTLNGANGATAIVLDAAAGALLLSYFHTSPAGAVTFATSGGSEDVDAAGGTGQVGAGSANASGDTISADWGSETTFAHCALVFAETDGEPTETDIDFAATIPLQSLAAAVEHDAPAFDVSYAAGIPIQSLAAVVEHEPPTFEAEFAATLPLQSLAAVVAATEPGAHTVGFAATVPLQSLNAEVGHEAPTYTASFAATIPLQVLDADVSGEAPAFGVAFAGTIPTQTLAADIATEAPVYDVAFAASIPMALLTSEPLAAGILYFTASLEPAIGMRADVQAVLDFGADVRPEIRIGATHLDPS